MLLIFSMVSSFLEKETNQYSKYCSKFSIICLFSESRLLSAIVNKLAGAVAVKATQSEHGVPDGLWLFTYGIIVVRFLRPFMCHTCVLRFPCIHTNIYMLMHTHTHIHTHTCTPDTHTCTDTHTYTNLSFFNAQMPKS